MRGWTDCSECLVLMPEAEEAVKDHNVYFFLNKMLHHKVTKLGRLKLKMSIKIYFVESLGAHLTHLGRSRLCY